MIQPKLNSLNVPLSDSRNAGDSELGWREFLVSLSYFTNHCSYRIKEDEIADITKSLFNWTNRKDLLRYKVRNTSTNNVVEGNIKLGDIFLVDLGINYKPECSYAHPALILEEIDGMVAIIPTSSNINKISAAYHPQSNNTGKWFYRRVGIMNGFNDECVLLLNNLRVVSKGRLIEKKGQLNEDINLINSLFSEVKYTIFSHYLPKQHINYLKLSEENDKLKENIKKLNDELDFLKQKS